jgi:hypothetical protein
MSPADDIEDTDPGLARERTELAWTRTAISFAAIGGVILKYEPAAGLLILALSVLIWELGRLARAPGPAGPGGSAAAAWVRSRRLLLIAVAVTIVSFVALAIVLFGPPSRGLRL